LIDVECPGWWLDASVGFPYPTPQPPNSGDAKNPPTYGTVYFFYDSDVAYDQGLDEVQKVMAEDEYSYWVKFCFIDMRDQGNQDAYSRYLTDPNARPVYLICPTSGEDSFTPVMDKNGNRLGDIEGEVLDSEHLRNDIKWLLFPPQTDQNGNSAQVSGGSTSTDSSDSGSVSGKDDGSPTVKPSGKDDDLRSAAPELQNMSQQMLGKVFFFYSQPLQSVVKSIKKNAA
jgi:hypothetical protein